ncbi:MAG: ribosomal protein S18-alanine N-acetyltransferase [Dehalococcoidia bacterium]|nr:MAG: ribosomal protein S18-alanine N-acetyltransferase [Dehalococcoidia bacterium]
MQATTVRYQVRPMDVGDISQVMEIERESFLNMWPTTAFKRELKHNRLARYLVAVEQREGAEEAVAPLAESEPKEEPVPPVHLGRWLGELKRLFGSEEEVEASREPIVGFVGIWLTLDEAHIVTIAVRESHRGRGIGELLLIAAIALATLNDQDIVTLEVRASNQAAQALYEKYGFKKVGVRHRYYSDNHEDAVIMTTDSIHAAPYRELCQRLRQEHRERCGDYELNFY